MPTPFRPAILLIIAILACCTMPAAAQTTVGSQKQDAGAWQLLFNGHNLDGFYTFIKTPGKNADPIGYFKVENNAIHVMGFPLTEEKRDFGYICTENEFG